MREMSAIPEVENETDSSTDSETQIPEAVSSLEDFLTCSEGPSLLEIVELLLSSDDVDDTSKGTTADKSTITSPPPRLNRTSTPTNTPNGAAKKGSIAFSQEVVLVKNSSKEINQSKSIQQTRDVQGNVSVEVSNLSSPSSYVTTTSSLISQQNLLSPSKIPVVRENIDEITQSSLNILLNELSTKHESKITETSLDIPVTQEVRNPPTLNKKVLPIIRIINETVSDDALQIIKKHLKEKLEELQQREENSQAQRQIPASPILQETSTNLTLQQQASSPTLKQILAASPTLQQQLDACLTLQNQAAASFISNQQLTASPTVPQHISDSLALQQQQRDLSALQQQQRDFSALQQQQRDFSALQQQQTDFSALQQQQRDFSALQQLQTDFSALQQQQRDFSALQQQQTDFSALQQQQQRDFTALQQQQTDFTSLKQQQDIFSLQHKLAASLLLQQHLAASPTSQQDLAASSTLQQRPTVSPTLEQLFASPPVQHNLSASLTLAQQQRNSSTLQQQQEVLSSLQEKLEPSSSLQQSLAASPKLPQHLASSSTLRQQQTDYSILEQHILALQQDLSATSTLQQQVAASIDLQPQQADLPHQQLDSTSETISIQNIETLLTPVYFPDEIRGKQILANIANIQTILKDRIIDDIRKRSNQNRSTKELFTNEDIITDNDCNINEQVLNRTNAREIIESRSRKSSNIEDLLDNEESTARNNCDVQEHVLHIASEGEVIQSRTRHKLNTKELPDHLDPITSDECLFKDFAQHLTNEGEVIEPESRKNSTLKTSTSSRESTTTNECSFQEQQTLSRKDEDKIIETRSRKNAHVKQMLRDQYLALNNDCVIKENTLHLNNQEDIIQTRPQLVSISEISPEKFDLKSINEVSATTSDSHSTKVNTVHLTADNIHVTADNVHLTAVNVSLKSNHESDLIPHIEVYKDEKQEPLEREDLPSHKLIDNSFLRSNLYPIDSTSYIHDDASLAYIINVPDVSGIWSVSPLPSNDFILKDRIMEEEKEEKTNSVGDNKKYFEEALKQGNDVGEKGISQKGNSEKGVSEKGVSEKGVSEKGVSEKGVSEKGVSEKGVSEKEANTKTTQGRPTEKLEIPQAIIEDIKQERSDGVTKDSFSNSRYPKDSNNEQEATDTETVPPVSVSGMKKFFENKLPMVTPQQGQPLREAGLKKETEMFQAPEVNDQKQRTSLNKETLDRIANSSRPSKIDKGIEESVPIIEDGRLSEKELKGPQSNVNEDQKNGIATNLYINEDTNQKMPFSFLPENQKRCVPGGPGGPEWIEPKKMSNSEDIKKCCCQQKKNALTGQQICPCCMNNQTYEIKQNLCNQGQLNEAKNVGASETRNSCVNQLPSSCMNQLPSSTCKNQIPSSRCMNQHPSDRYNQVQIEEICKCCQKITEPCNTLCRQEKEKKEREKSSKDPSCPCMYCPCQRTQHNLPACHRKERSLCEDTIGTDDTCTEAYSGQDYSTQSSMECFTTKLDANFTSIKICFKTNGQVQVCPDYCSCRDASSADCLDTSASMGSEFCIEASYTRDDFSNSEEIKNKNGKKVMFSSRCDTPENSSSDEEIEGESKI